MSRPSAVPFVIRRSHAVVRAREVTDTREESHGVLRLEPGRVVAQWRTARQTTRTGREVRTDREIGPVHEVAMPLAGLAGTRVRRRFLRWPPGWQLVLRAADLQAFEGLAGEAGLLLEHPAELVLDVRPADREAAREFAADLELALAEAALADAEGAAEAAALEDGRRPGAGGGAIGAPRPRNLPRHPA